jgi:hypothetical protein
MSSQITVHPESPLNDPNLPEFRFKIAISPPELSFYTALGISVLFRLSTVSKGMQKEVRWKILEYSKFELKKPNIDEDIEIPPHIQENSSRIEELLNMMSDEKMTIAEKDRQFRNKAIIICRAFQKILAAIFAKSNKLEEAKDVLQGKPVSYMNVYYFHNFAVSLSLSIVVRISDDNPIQAIDDTKNDRINIDIYCLNKFTNEYCMLKHFKDIDFIRTGNNSLNNDLPFVMLRKKSHTPITSVNITQSNPQPVPANPNPSAFPGNQVPGPPGYSGHPGLPQGPPGLPQGPPGLPQGPPGLPQGPPGSYNFQGLPQGLTLSNSVPVGAHGYQGGNQDYGYSGYPPQGPPLPGIPPPLPGAQPGYPSMTGNPSMQGGPPFYPGQSTGGVPKIPSGGPPFYPGQSVGGVNKVPSNGLQMPPIPPAYQPGPQVPPSGPPIPPSFPGSQQPTSPPPINQSPPPLQDQDQLTCELNLTSYLLSLLKESSPFFSKEESKQLKKPLRELKKNNKDKFTKDFKDIYSKLSLSCNSNHHPRDFVIFKQCGKRHCKSCIGSNPGPRVICDCHQEISFEDMGFLLGKLIICGYCKTPIENISQAVIQGEPMHKSCFFKAFNS